jgi:protein-disulfide isomerase
MPIFTGTKYFGMISFRSNAILLLPGILGDNCEIHERFPFLGLENMRITLEKLLQIILIPLIVVIALLPSVSSQEVNTEQILGGKPDAPVRIEVFSDFQCPACRSLYLETMKQILRDYCPENKVCLIYHEFPLKMHQFARLAARYALAAQRLGRTQWEAVMDTLYTNQSQWSLDGNIDIFIAKALSPDDLQKVRRLINEASINDAVNRDMTLGNQKVVAYTPTIFLYAGGREQKIEKGIDYSLLKEYLDRIVK